MWYRAEHHGLDTCVVSGAERPPCANRARLGERALFACFCIPAASKFSRIVGCRVVGSWRAQCPQLNVGLNSSSASRKLCVCGKVPRQPLPHVREEVHNLDFTMLLCYCPWGSRCTRNVQPGVRHAAGCQVMVLERLCVFLFSHHKLVLKIGKHGTALSFV